MLALKALIFLADCPGDLERFLALSGVVRGDIRALAAERAFLSGVLDFVLSEDALLTRFCACKSVDPKTVHLVRAQLSAVPATGK